MKQACRFLVVLALIAAAVSTAASERPVALVGTGEVGSFVRPPDYYDVWADLFPELEVIHAAPDVLAAKLFSIRGLGGRVDLIFDNVESLLSYARAGFLHPLGTPEEVAAELDIDRESLILADGKVVGLQVRQAFQWSPLRPASLRWGMAWISGSAFDEEALRIFRLAADLLQRRSLPDDQGYEAICKFLEYLLILQDVDSSVHYLHPRLREDEQALERYLRRLRAYAFTEQFAERGVTSIHPDHPIGDGTVERLATWQHPVTGEVYDDVIFWPVAVGTRGGFTFILLLHLARHDGVWYVLDF